MLYYNITLLYYFQDIRVGYAVLGVGRRGRADRGGTGCSASADDATAANHRERTEPDLPSAGARRRRSGAARHAADCHRPVRDRHRCSAGRTATQSRLDTRRRAVRQAGHYRFELCAGRSQPPDHSRPRYEPRRHHRQRRWRRRRLGPGRRSLRAGQSFGDQSGRGDPRPGHAALRLAGDRRRCRLDQQPHPRGAALRSIQSASPAAGHHQGSGVER